MSSISKALEQMQRGMASEVGRLEVNAETMAARQQRKDDRQARLNALEKVAPVADRKSIQDGDFGRLD